MEDDDVIEASSRAWTPLHTAMIEAVLAGMHAHAGAVGVQKQGCAALANLAMHKENEEAIVEAGRSRRCSCRAAARFGTFT